ncbi:MAG: efflux RND transporter periplasmic adaptor subunit [Bacteroidales bacterium]
MKNRMLIFLMLSTVSCGNRKEQISPTIGPISESVYASGIIKSKNQYQVYSSVNGLIQNILVREGDTVRKGDPLIKILNESSKLNTYNAQLAANNADLFSNTDKLGEAKVNISVSVSKMKDDSLLLARQRILWAEGIGSRVEFEQRQLAYKNSVANFQLAKLRYHELQRQLEFTANQAKTNLKISALQTGDYYVNAEAGGRVYKIFKEKGEFVSTLIPLAIVGDATAFLIEMNVDEYDIARIHMGQRVLFTMDSYKGKVFEAKVDRIEPLMNEKTRSFTVNALFVSKPEVLYPNLTVEANIIIQSREKALTIPRSYLVGDSMVQMKKGKMRQVIVGLKDYQRVEIINGLSAGDVINKPTQ